MPSFTDVVTGHSTLAADVNQLVDALNGTVASQVNLLATASTALALGAALPSAPAADQTVLQALVSADANGRADIYIRSTGYGGLRAGPGGATAPTAHLYAQAAGWRITESLVVDSNLTVSGTGTIAGLVVTGTSSLDNGAITSDGSGHLTAAAFHGVADSVLGGGGVNASDPYGWPMSSTSGRPLRTGSTFSGAGTATVNHNMNGGQTPTGILVCPNLNGSATIGYDTITSSTVHVTIGSSFAFTGICTKW